MSELGRIGKFPSEVKGEIVENQVPFGWVKLRIEVCAGSDGTNLSIEWSSVKRPKRSNM